jgi:hypothetical protein
MPASVMASRRAWPRVRTDYAQGRPDGLAPPGGGTLGRLEPNLKAKRPHKRAFVPERCRFSTDCGYRFPAPALAAPAAAALSAFWKWASVNP